LIAIFFETSRRLQFRFGNSCTSNTSEVRGQRSEEEKRTKHE
jgi:hypothetical protein